MSLPISEDLRREWGLSANVNLCPKCHSYILVRLSAEMVITTQATADLNQKNHHFEKPFLNASSGKASCSLQNCDKGLTRNLGNHVKRKKKSTHFMPMWAEPRMNFRHRDERGFRKRGETAAFHWFCTLLWDFPPSLFVYRCYRISEYSQWRPKGHWPQPGGEKASVTVRFSFLYTDVVWVNSSYR